MNRRRLMSMFGGKLKGQIIIEGASSSKYVTVDGAKYTAPTTIPFEEEVSVEIHITAFYLNNLTRRTIYEWDTSDYINFTALPGYTYTIDAVNKTVVIDRPPDNQWDGVIFTSSKKTYPCLPMKVSGTDGGVIQQKNSSYYWCQATSSEYTNNITYGPIDVTNFKTLYFESSGSVYLNETRSSSSLNKRRANYKLQVGTTSGGSDIADVTKYLEDGAVTTVNLSNVTGDIYIYVRNIYSDQSVAVKEMKLLK